MSSARTSYWLFLHLWLPLDEPPPLRRSHTLTGLRMARNKVSSACSTKPRLDALHTLKVALLQYVSSGSRVLLASPTSVIGDWHPTSDGSGLFVRPSSIVTLLASLPWLAFPHLILKLTCHYFACSFDTAPRSAIFQKGPPSAPRSRTTPLPQATLANPRPTELMFRGTKGKPKVYQATSSSRPSSAKMSINEAQEDEVVVTCAFTRLTGERFQPTPFQSSLHVHRALIA